MSVRVMRVCLVAENASVRMGGEAILPYHYFRILRARGVDAWLVVHERSRAELELLFSQDRERLIFVADMALQKLFFQAGKMLPRRVAEATFGLANQMLTQYAQRAIVRKLRTESTVVHQPIPVSPRFPSLLWGLDAPVVIGPLNGAMEYPAAFRGAESWVSRVAIALGRSLSDAVNAMLPGKRRAAVVLVANARTQAALPSGLQGSVVEIAENGVDLTRWSDGCASEGGERDFVFIGRLVDWKSVDIVIDALQKVDGATLKIIGDGPMLDSWAELAEARGVAGRVHFAGWLSQEQCAAQLARACALVLPSVYECGGAVVLEAMASGKPVIATAWGGPLDYLNASCGVLIEPSSHEALVTGFAAAMREFAEDPALARRMGEAGRARVRECFDWEKKVDAVMEIYESVLPAETAAI